MKRNEILHPSHPNGIYHYETPMINGIKQYIQIRGQDSTNPVLLFLHGGPGGAMSGITHIVHAGWEEHFTVVNWDQRNAGRTYTVNKKRAKEIAQTGTMEDFVQDIHEIIAYLHTVLSFDKLILLGFSWGSAIGAEYAKRHPENLRCFISVGQHVHYRSGVMLTCEKLLHMMPEGSADAGKVRKMMEEMPEQPVWNRELMQCLRHFMPLCGKYIMKHAKRTPILEVLCSPFWNFREKWLSTVPNDALLVRARRTMLEYDFRQNLHFEVPVLFVFGAEETVCPSELVQACFETISAPQKQIAVIPEAAHCCFYDQPKAFMQVIEEFINILH